MVKKLLLIIIPLVLIASHLGQRVRLWHQTKKEIEQMREELGRLKEEEKTLSEKEKYFQGEEFIRREAREKLGMTKEGEIILVLPPLPDLSTLQAKGEKYENLPPWEQWWQLFFSN